MYAVVSVVGPRGVWRPAFSSRRCVSSGRNRRPGLATISFLVSGTTVVVLHEEGKRAAFSDGIGHLVKPRGSVVLCAELVLSSCPKLAESGNVEQ